MSLRAFAWPLAAVCVAFAAAQTVNVTLSSPQDGTNVAAGAAISWQISFTTSTGNNAGLALLATDLVQGAGNPAFLNLPPASGVPSGMVNFSRPAGCSNPGEGGPTGYVGVQRGTAGARNLIQIGGGQNNFGVAQAPGTGIAENANVVAGVGQSSSVVLASGTFNVPAACGTYTYNLQNVIANTFSQINAPPTASPATQATVNIVDGTISVTVGPQGDLTGDNMVDSSDLGVLLGDWNCTGGNCAGDVDGDGSTGSSDLGIILANWLASC